MSNSPVLRVLIQGPGAVGRLFAGFLARAGQEVSLLDRDLERTRSLQEQGLELRDESGSRQTFQLTVHSTSNSSTDPSFEPYDLLVCCVKSYDVEHALETGTRFLREGGWVLVVSNGLGNLEKAELAWPATRCAAASNSYGAVRSGDTGVQLRGEGHLRIGIRKQTATSSSSLREFESIVSCLSSAMTVDSTQTVEEIVWEKTAVNCAINPLATSLGVTNGELLDLPAFDSAQVVAREVAQVARAEGVTVDDTSIVAQVVAICEATRTNRCSMLEDLSRGHQTEIDTLCGEVVRRAKRHGIATPYNELLSHMIASLERLSSRSQDTRKYP